MDIKKLMKQMNNASDPQEKELIKKKIKTEFDKLSEKEKDEVKKDFLDSLDEKLSETKTVIEKTDLTLDIKKISKYISLSAISKDYFGKSKEWLYQRIKGYLINGKKAEFTKEERQILSNALQDISEKLKETSLKIA